MAVTYHFVPQGYSDFLSTKVLEKSYVGAQFIARTILLAISRNKLRSYRTYRTYRTMPLFMRAALVLDIVKSTKSGQVQNVIATSHPTHKTIK
jgi:hypothetical protein